MASREADDGWGRKASLDYPVAQSAASHHARQCRKDERKSKEDFVKAGHWSSVSSRNACSSFSYIGPLFARRFPQAHRPSFCHPCTASSSDATTAEAAPLLSRCSPTDLSSKQPRRNERRGRHPAHRRTGRVADVILDMEKQHPGLGLGWAGGGT